MDQVVEVPNVSWEDIGGLENVKRELQEVIVLDLLGYSCDFHSCVSLAKILLVSDYLHDADCPISSGAS